MMVTVSQVSMIRTQLQIVFILVFWYCELLFDELEFLSTYFVCHAL